MRVSIGKYTNWFGPYQLANLLRFVGVNKDTRISLGEFLSKTWIGDFLQWVEDKKQRKVKIVIDDYDLWNMDHTLALIILPMLIKFKNSSNGSFAVDNQDVPEHLRDPNFDKPSNNIDENYHKRCEWILDQMIWSFEQVVSGDQFVDTLDPSSKTAVDDFKNYYEKVQIGLTLFGKYFKGLWT